MNSVHIEGTKFITVLTNMDLNRLLLRILLTLISNPSSYILLMKFEKHFLWDVYEFVHSIGSILWSNVYLPINYLL